MGALKFELRKLSLGEILDESFDLFKHGFWRFLFFQLVLYGPAIAGLVVTLHLGGNAIIHMAEPGEVPQLSDIFRAVAVLSAGAVLIAGVVWPISAVALARGVADTWLSRKWTVSSILWEAIKVAPS